MLFGTAESGPAAGAVPGGVASGGVASGGVVGVIFLAGPLAISRQFLVMRASATVKYWACSPSAAKRPRSVPVSHAWTPSSSSASNKARRREAVDALLDQAVGEPEARGDRPGVELLPHREEDRQRGEYYAVQRERPFYGSLVKFMTEGPVVVMSLEAPDAIRLRVGERALHVAEHLALDQCGRQRAAVEHQERLIAARRQLVHQPRR